MNAQRNTLPGLLPGLLLDTHIVLWWLLDSPELPAAARAAISAGNSRVVVSAASGWEIAAKHRLGKLPEANHIVEHLPAYLRKERFEVLPISMEHALAAGRLPGPHRDPFDRMLIAQAQIERLRMVTVDLAFEEYAVEILR